MILFTFLPITLLFAPVSNFFGSFYEVWVVTGRFFSAGRGNERGEEERTRKDKSGCLCCFLLPIVGYIVYIQASYSLAEFEEERLL